MTISGRADCMDSSNVFRLRTSAIVERISLSIPHRSNKLGSVGGCKAYPCTSAPRECSHRQSQDPLKPVWPVRNTFLPFQNSVSITRYSLRLLSRTNYTSHFTFFCHRILFPHFPRRFPITPKLLKMVLVTQGVHGLPEPVVFVGNELIVPGQ